MSTAARAGLCPRLSLPAGSRRPRAPAALPYGAPKWINPCAGAAGVSTTTSSTTSPHRATAAGHHRPARRPGRRGPAGPTASTTRTPHRRPATAGRPGIHVTRRTARPAAAARTGWSPSSAAIDTELGILKTGKEADVFLVRRGVPGTDRPLPAGGQAVPGAPSTGCSTATPATSKGAACGGPGRCGRWPTGPRSAGTLIAGQWAGAEFDALCRLCDAVGVAGAVPGAAPSAPSCCWSSSATPDGTGRARGWRSCARSRPS